jgi:cyclic pyranopterin phosphate synthase
MVLRDNWGRPLLNLRIAVTRECNLNCAYCHGEGEEVSDKNLCKEMTADEIVRMARIAVGLGVAKIKLTGGEPLMRRDITSIIRGINDIRGLTDLSMTTNGSLLGPLAKDLHDNGLNRVNISLPTLNEEDYRNLTGGRVEDALRGVKAAVDAGLSPVKLNMLILKHTNELAVPEMMEFAAQARTTLQLIELEPVNITAKYYNAKHKPLNEYENLLRQKAVKVETRQYMQNRHIYHLPDLKVEVIHPIENTEFCMNCTRLRITSDGKLKPCLMKNDNTVDILNPMRSGADDKELTDLFKQVNQKRQPFNRNQASCQTASIDKR